jgi:hypothetical protein
MAAPLKPLSLVPTLDALIERPSLATTLTAEAAESLLAQASARSTALQSARDALLMRIATASLAPAKVAEPKSRSLNADQIAAALGQSRRWVFRNLGKLEFVRRVSRKSLVASEADLLKWRATQRA